MCNGAVFFICSFLHWLDVMALLAESVALASDGSLWMLDKWGLVWRAPEDGKGSYALEKEPLAQLGPGRPLGFHFDEEGNLIVCNAGSVRSFLCQSLMFSGKRVILPCRHAVGSWMNTIPDL